MNNKRLVSITTLGCKVNQYESNQIAKKLEDNGFEVIFEITKADAYVVNTCAVTNEAEKKSRGIIAKIKKHSETAPIFISGCSAQNDSSKFEKFNNVKVILGTSRKINIATHIIEYFNKPTNKIYINTDINKEYEKDYLSKGDRTRAVIKIQEGCNNFCSYCLIPYLRGRERSRTINSIKTEIQEQAKISKEIVFAGINLSNWGKDFNNGSSLKDIAILMNEWPNLRFRFSSLEQDVITEEFLQVLKQTPNFAPHFHLSLQSGCDRTLKYMNRKYISKDYFNKVKLIRKYFNNAAITTDIIVGFPTETEEDFIESYNFAKKCRFSKIHVFPYSVRSGTVASKLKNVATNVKERAHTLSLLDEKMQNEYIKQNKNRIYTVIIEQKHNDFYEGHTENYIKCYIKTDKILQQNSVVTVKIGSAYKDGALAEIVSY